MNRLDRIQRISGALRVVLLVATVFLMGAVLLALMVPGQDWVTLGNGALNELRDSGAIGPGVMAAIAAPFILILALGIFWLQRLLGEYQRGNFFTDGSMRCYIWLVWLKAASFVYGIIWPLLLRSLSSTLDSADTSVTIEAGTLVELIVLLVIVHLLKAAQQIHDENKAFV